MNINPMAFIENLRYMGVGMLCIIIVMAIIIAVTAFLNWISARKYFTKKIGKGAAAMQRRLC